MWQLFGLEIGRFSLLVLAALMVFGLFWLYFDAWKDRKNMRDVPLLIGLLLLSLSLLAQGMSLETHVLVSAWKGTWGDMSHSAYIYIRAVAYLLMLAGLYLTPIEPRPTVHALFGLSIITVPFQFALPILAAFVALLYWRRASIGLEQHIVRVAIGFGLLSLYELLGLSTVFRTTHTVWIARLVAPFGILTLIQYGILIVAIYILARWTWYYLLKRLSTQLFMLTLSGAVALSLVITGLFVSLLLKSVETESLQKLRGNAKVISSLLEEKKARLLSETKLLSIDPTVLSTISSGERKTLIPVVKNHMVQTGVASLIVVDSQGKIILKGENEEERGTSLSEEGGVKKALHGETSAGFTSRDGVIGPEVRLQVVVPAGNGAIIAAQTLDNSYVDGIRTTTGMSVSIYGNLVLSSTTEDSGDGQTRLVGIKETNSDVLEQVWKKGMILAAPTELGEHTYLSGYIPLKDLDNTTVGALQVAEPQIIALQTAGRAVQLTFALVIAIIILLSFPIYAVCQHLVAEWE